MPDLKLARAYLQRLVDTGRANPATGEVNQIQRQPPEVDHADNLRDAEGLKTKVPAYCVPMLDRIIAGYEELLQRAVQLG